MVGVLILHPERSGLSDSSSKTRVVYVVLPIAVTWRGVDEPTPENPFFIQPKKKKKKKTPKLKSHKIFDHVPHIFFLPSLSKTSNYSSDLYNFNYTQGTHTISFSCSNAIYLANFNFIQYLRFSHDHV